MLDHLRIFFIWLIMWATQYHRPTMWGPRSIAFSWCAQLQFHYGVWYANNELVTGAYNYGLWFIAMVYNSNNYGL